MSADNKSIMELADTIYRNYAYTIGECVEDMLSTGRITTDDLKKDRSLKKLDWGSVASHTSSEEVKNIAETKISG